MLKLIFKGATVITPLNVIEKATIIIEEGRVRDVYKGSTRDPDAIDVRGYVIAPGLIDTHVHGIEGDYVYEGFKSLERISKNLLKYGVTAFTPTTMSLPHEELLEVCRYTREFITAQKRGEIEGAKVLGLHLEGPYINVSKRGAQNPKYIRKPNVKEFLEYYKESGGNISIITLAPELPGAIDLIREALRYEVTVSIGHTDATFEEAKKAIGVGARRATHLYNSMRGVHHRDPGVVIAVLGDNRVYVELIADMIHVHPEMLKYTIRTVGFKRVILATDTISATGMPDGEYELCGLKITVRNGVPTIKDGTLAGSTVALDKALRNVVKEIGIPLKNAIRAATLNPAITCNKPYVGTLERLYEGDAIVLTEDLKVVKTIVNGEILYEKE